MNDSDWNLEDTKTWLWTLCIEARERKLDDPFVTIKLHQKPKKEIPPDLLIWEAFQLLRAEGRITGRVVTGNNVGPVPIMLRLVTLTPQAAEKLEQFKKATSDQTKDKEIGFQWIRLLGYWKQLEDYGLEEEKIPTPPEPRIRVIVRCPEYLLAQEVDFFIDTGTTITTIMPKDRKKFPIPPYCLSEGFPSSIVGILKDPIPAKHLINVSLEFPTVNGKKAQIPLPRILIAAPNKQQERLLSNTDSCLGRDILQICRLDLTGSSPILEYSA